MYLVSTSVYLFLSLSLSYTHTHTHSHTVMKIDSTKKYSLGLENKENSLFWRFDGILMYVDFLLLISKTPKMWGHIFNMNKRLKRSWFIRPLQFHWWSVCLQCGRPGFDPWVRKIPWRRKWQPTLVLLTRKSHGRRSLVQATAHGVAKSWTQLSDFTFFLSLQFHYNF